MAVVGVGHLGGDPAGGEHPRVDRPVHGEPGAEDADLPVAVAGGLVGDHLGDVEAAQGELGSGQLQGHVGGVVRADEEVGPGPGQPAHALGQRGPDRAVVAPVPGRHAAAQGDAVQGHVGMLVGAEPGEPLLAEGPEAQRGPSALWARMPRCLMRHRRPSGRTAWRSGRRGPAARRARLDDAAVLHHRDLVGLGDGGQPVSDDDDGDPARAQPLEGVGDAGL